MESDAIAGPCIWVVVSGRDWNLNTWVERIWGLVISETADVKLRSPFSFMKNLSG